MSISRITLTPREAYLAWLPLAFGQNETIWFKFGHDRFFTGIVSQSGSFPIWATRGSEKNRRKSVCYDDGYAYLSQLAKSLDGGAFYIPGKPSEYPLKEFCSASDDIGAEMDDGTAEEQWQRVELVAQLSSLTPAYIIGSGGKSAHPHWKLTASVPVDQRTFYARMMAIALLGDPAVTNPHQPMRVPGFFRKEKGKEQTLEFYSEARYTAQEFEAGMQRCFTALGFVWWSAEQFSDERWRRIRQILVNKHLSRYEKQDQIRDVLALPEAVINPPRREPRPVSDFQYSGDRIPLEFFLSRENKKLLEAGQSEGDRDNAGFRVAKDLIGLGDTLLRLGINYDGDPRQLFEDFAARCSPPLASRDIERIWRSASRGTPKAALPDNAIQSRVSFWQWQQNPQKGQQWDESAEFYSKRAAEFEEWEENCDRHIELQQQESFRSFFSNRLEKLKNKALALRCSSKFQVKSSSRSFWSRDRDSNEVTFEAEDRITTIQTLAQQAAAENRQLIVLDASEGGTGKSHLAGELTPQALGVNTIFYTSPTHRNPSVASIEQNYTDLPVRHDGLVSDSTKLTPLGNPYVRWAKPGEEPNVEGNCSKAHLFQTFGAKGYQEVSTEAAINPICNTCKWKSNCAGAEGLPTIPRHTFRQERRNALASDRIRCNLDSLPDIAKMQGNPEDEKEQTRVAVVVDEFTQFRGYSETQANLSDFDNAWMYFKSQVHKAESRIKQLTDQQQVLQAQVNAKLAESEVLEAQLEAITAQQHLNLGRLTQADNTQTVQQLESEIARLDAESGELIEDVLQVSAEIDAIRKNTELLPGAIAALEPTIFALRAILNGEHEVTSVTRYGWDEAAVRGLLGDLTGLEQHLAVIRAFNPKLAALLHESDSVTLDGMSADDRKGSARVLKVARKAMQREADKENREAIANMPSNCVVPLLEILLGEKQGSFRVNFKDLIIFTRNDRHRDQLKQADFTLILDGTKTRESLAQDLGVDPSEIVVIRQKRSDHANLRITQIPGMGLLGRDRSESMNQRLKALTNTIQEQHGVENVGIIDHAACIADTAQESESGYWFNDNRGSNRFEDKTALLTFGSPFPNIGQLQLQYTTLTGDRNPDKDNAQFAAFVQDRVQSEVAQSGWRLRSSRREGEHLTWYVVSDQDLSYLREYFPDAEFEVKAAFQITPNAGSLGEQTYWAVLQASKQLVESGKELTTRALAQIVGCNRSRISQIAKDVAGGFEAFQRVLMFLLKSLYRTTNTPRTAQCGEEEVLSEEEVFAAKTYLPLVLEENVQTPDDGVKQILESAESFGKESFERVLRALSFKDKAQLLGQMLTLLPQDWQQEFLDLGRELQPEVTNAI